jgi:hypothetical protein
LPARTACDDSWICKRELLIYKHCLEFFFFLSMVLLFA